MLYAQNSLEHIAFSNRYLQERMVTKQNFVPLSHIYGPKQLIPFISAPVVPMGLFSCAFLSKYRKIWQEQLEL